MTTGIYQIKNKLNQKRYIGSAKDISRRFREHKSYLLNNRHHSEQLQNSWNKHSPEDFEFQVLEYCSVKDLIVLEQIWINKFDFNELYNVCKVAGSRLGTKNPPISEETRKKMSEAQKKIGNRPPVLRGSDNPNYGKPLSEERKEKLRQANIGRKDTLETKEKKRIASIKAGNKPPIGYGRKMTIKTREALLKSSVKEWKFINPVGELFEFRNLSEFCRRNNLNHGLMNMVHTGKRGHHKGWRKPGDKEE